MAKGEMLTKKKVVLDDGKEALEVTPMYDNTFVVRKTLHQPTVPVAVEPKERDLIAPEPINPNQLTEKK